MIDISIGRLALYHVISAAALQTIFATGYVLYIGQDDQGFVGLILEAIAGLLMIGLSTFVSIRVLTARYAVRDPASFCVRSGVLNAILIVALGVILLAGWIALHSVDSQTPALNWLLISSVALSAVSNASLFYVFSRTSLPRQSTERTVSD